MKQSPIGTADNSPPVSTVGRQFWDAKKPRQGRKSHFIIATPLYRPWRDLLLATRPRVCPPLKRVGYSLSPSGLENSHSTKNSEEPERLYVKTTPILRSAILQYSQISTTKPGLNPGETLAASPLSRKVKPSNSKTSFSRTCTAPPLHFCSPSLLKVVILCVIKLPR